MRVIHFEIHAKDLDKVQEFYSTVFGWKIKDMGPKMGNYRIVVTGKDKAKTTWPGINGGITPRMGAKPKNKQAVNAFVCTIDVPDIDKYIGKVKKAGGSMATKKMQVQGVGWLAYAKDIENNIFGMLESK